MLCQAKRFSQTSIVYSMWFEVRTVVRIVCYCAGFLSSVATSALGLFNAFLKAHTTYFYVAYPLEKCGKMRCFIFQSHRFPPRTSPLIVKDSIVRPNEPTLGLLSDDSECVGSLLCVFLFWTYYTQNPLALNVNNFSTQCQYFYNYLFSNSVHLWPAITNY